MYRIGFVILLATSAAADQVYKWTDEKGVTHYSNSKPENIAPQKTFDIQNAYTPGISPKSESPKPNKTAPNQPNVFLIDDNSQKINCTSQKINSEKTNAVIDAYQDSEWKKCHGMQ